MSDSGTSSSSSAMASVWDTLNKMKARQKAAESVNRHTKRYDVARRDAIQLFERQIELAASQNKFDGVEVLRDMRHAMDTDQNVRAVIDNHKQRFKTLPPAHELQALSVLLNDASALLASANSCLTNANRIAQPLKR